MKIMTDYRGRKLYLIHIPATPYGYFQYFKMAIYGSLAVQSSIYVIPLNKEGAILDSGRLLLLTL